MLMVVEEMSWRLPRGRTREMKELSLSWAKGTGGDVTITGRRAGPPNALRLNADRSL